MKNNSDQIESKRQLTTYASLCSEYYDLDKPNPPEDALAFYAEYARCASDPILEPMCKDRKFNGVWSLLPGKRFQTPLIYEGWEQQATVQVTASSMLHT